MECVGWILAVRLEQRRLAAPALAAREGWAAGGTPTLWREQTLGQRKSVLQLCVPASEDSSWVEEELEQLWWSHVSPGAALDVPVQG